MKIHLWRYDAYTPTEEQPWMVTREGTIEPHAFRTWGEAVAFVCWLLRDPNNILTVAT